MPNKPAEALRLFDGVRALEIERDPRVVARYLREMVLDRHLADAPHPVQRFIFALASMIDPDSQNEITRLVFLRRAGNQMSSAEKTVRDSFLVHDMNVRIEEYLKSGKPKRGLVKKVAGEIGKRYNLKGDTVEDIWEDAKREAARIHSDKPTFRNALMVRHPRPARDRKRDPIRGN